MENQELLRVNHLKKYFQTPSGTLSAVDDVTFGINRMETLGVVGESGCGKTTITRLINGLIPHYYEGKMRGGVWVNGAEVSKQPLYDTAKIVGSVFQNPRSQFFNVDTTSEITFGCENLGMPKEEIVDH